MERAGEFANRQGPCPLPAVFAAKSRFTSRLRSSANLVFPRFHCFQIADRSLRPEPLLKTQQHRRRFTLAEVADPTPQIPGQFLGHPLDAHPSRPARQFPYPLLEPVHRFRCYAPLWYACARKAEAQKLPRPWPGHRALLFVDLEFERRGEESLEALHHPFPGPLATNVDITVSSPGESHPEAILEPYVNLSAHTAPAMERSRTPSCQCAHNFGSRREIRATQ